MYYPAKKKKGEGVLSPCQTVLPFFLHIQLHVAVSHTVTEHTDTDSKSEMLAATQTAKMDPWHLILWLGLV